MIVGALFLGTYFVPFLALIGVALAYYFERHDEEEWEPSHFRYLIRTFWIAFLTPLVIVVIALVASIFAETAGLNFDFDDVATVTGISLLIIMLPILIFCGVRIVLSLMKSVSHKPMPSPQTWLL
ncbi:MAG: hypothetical protein HKP43_01215 [Altererythrobacter sp.]|nr:hypothetical protein [Altererythrobacter sp.]